MTGTMIVCLSCRKVVWAHGAYSGDVYGLLNMLRLPCRLCGERSNYDGWHVSEKMAWQMGCCDVWIAMRQIAEDRKFVWAISPNGAWE